MSLGFLNLLLYPCQLVKSLFLLCSVSLWLLLYREISTSIYPYIASFWVVGWKKHVLFTLKGKKWWICNSGHFMILRTVPPACSTCFFQICWISPPPPKKKIEISNGCPSTTQSPSSKNYSVCSYENPYLFPAWAGTVSFTSFHFLESSAYFVPLSVSLKMGFSPK